MRIVLVGLPRDRDRVRAELLDAGMDIVAELSIRPDPSSPLSHVDAIIEARPPESPIQLRRDLARAAAPEALTPREHEVLALLAEGRSNKSIADALGISDQTVKFHVAAIISKLDATNRTDAVRRAIRQGLVAI